MQCTTVGWLEVPCFFGELIYLFQVTGFIFHHRMQEIFLVSDFAGMFQLSCFFMDSCLLLFFWGIKLPVSCYRFRVLFTFWEVSCVFLDKVVSCFRSLHLVF